MDTVGSYFAMREIRIDGPNILLNGHPLYQRLILDQGYWKDSHLTPPSEEALVEDIDKILQRDAAAGKSASNDDGTSTGNP